MAAPVFVGAGTGVVITTGNADVTKTGATVGNVIVYHQFIDGTSSTGVPTVSDSSVENLAGTNNALTDVSGLLDVGSPAAAKHRVYMGRAKSTTVTINQSTSGNDMYCRVYEFAGVHTGTSLSDVIENGSAGLAQTVNGTSTTITDCDVITLGADRLALNFVGVNDDNTLDAFSGQSGGTWAEAVAEYAESTGTDAALGLQSATMASAGTIDGGSDTMAASDAWGVIGFALIPAASGPTEHQGSFAMNLSPAISFAAVRETSTGFAQNLSPSIAVAAIRQTFSGFAMALDPVIAVNAIREAITGITFPIGLTVDTAAVRETFGGITMPLGPQIDTAVFKETFGSITFPVDLTISVDATSSTGGVEQFASITFPLGLTISTDATRGTFTGFTQDLSPTIVVGALRETFGAITTDMSPAIAVNVFKETFGAFAANLSPAISVDSTRETTAGFSVDLSIDLGTQATRETFTAIATALELAIQTAVTKETFGAITFPIELTIHTEATIAGQVGKRRMLLGVGK